MQKQWEIKVVRCINEWASFSCQWNGTKSTTWKSHARHCNEFSNHQPHTHTRVHHMLKNHLCRSFYKRLAAILHSRRAAALLPLFFFFSQKHLRCLGSRLVALAARERYGSDERVDRGEPWDIAWGEVRGEGTDETDDRVDGRETVGNSLGRAPWGRSGTEATTRLNAGIETVGNSMRRAPLGRSDTEATRGWTESRSWEMAWGELGWEEATYTEKQSCWHGFSRQIPSMRLSRKTVRPRLYFQRYANIGRRDMHSFVGRERH